MRIECPWCEKLYSFKGWVHEIGIELLHVEPNGNVHRKESARFVRGLCDDCAAKAWAALEETLYVQGGEDES